MYFLFFSSYILAVLSVSFCFFLYLVWHFIYLVWKALNNYILTYWFCPMSTYFLFVVSLQTRDRIGSGGPVVDCRGLLENDGWAHLQTFITLTLLQLNITFRLLSFVRNSSDLFSRAASAKSRCPTPTPPAPRAAGTAGWTHRVRRAVCRLCESEGRTPEVMATPLRTDLTGINRLICQRDTVRSQTHLSAI